MSVDSNTQAARLTAGPAREHPSPTVRSEPPAHAEPGWRALAAGPVIAVVTVIAALVTTQDAGVPFRDPDHVVGKRLLLVFGLVGLLVVLDVAVRAGRACGRRIAPRAELRRVWRERWTPRRRLAVGSALVSFYVTYLAYRNLKSVVPLLRPGDLFDRELADVDRALFLGNDPWALVHGLLGTGVSAELLSLAYGLFFVFIPATLAVALVFSANLQAGLFYVTAQSLNWTLGAASYFALPALGPIYAYPEDFTKLPTTDVSKLQEFLIDQRTEFLVPPHEGSQAIAAFSSLHISIFFTGVLAAYLLGQKRGIKIAAWLCLGVTALATIALGWHYVVDDIAGLALAAAAVALAYVLTGIDPRPGRQAAMSGGRA